MKLILISFFIALLTHAFSYAFASADSAFSAGTSSFVSDSSFSTMPSSTLKLEESLNGKGLHSNLTLGHGQIPLSLALQDSFYVKGSPVKVIKPLETGINYTMLGSLGAAYMASVIAIDRYMANQWWQKPSKFYFSRDYFSKLSNFNKFSHFYSVNLLGHLFSGAYEASGMQALGSTWYSSLSALAYISCVETENGFHTNNGFSLSNFSAGVLGTIFYIGQYYIPEMKDFMPKMSYKPTENLKNKGRIFFDDYQGQKYWMSVRLKNYLPEKISGFWPEFLMVAAGVGLKEGFPDKKGPMEMYVALDLDAEKLPLYGAFWQFVKNTLNYFHFPMPGVRLSPGSAFFMFCF
ncbi:MAG: DUF2279 domain-containing protein [Ignavibacteria bacterium]|jgi:hypothetical protein|nr:DUF2279 domain-containing protein [Ignavibacteria bacterium]MCU7501555.1 DUF2279 domain-containing protein [Ignavibacteria bacterium]MCU7517092.1 DUF2279 domain-containing protein [Ignavibacteria bacterium]